MTNTNKILTLIGCFVFLFLLSPMKVLAGPHYTLDAATGEYTNGSSFSVIVGVTGIGESGMVTGDVDLNFDKTKLEITSVEKLSNTVFPYSSTVNFQTDNVNGTMIVSLFSDDTSILLGGGKPNISRPLFKINFKAKAEGTAAVTFDCTTGKTDDTNIFLAPSATEGIVCSENTAGSYTIKAASSSTTTTSTTTPTPTTAVTATELPQTGSVGTTILLTLLGTLGVIGAFLLKI